MLTKIWISCCFFLLVLLVFSGRAQAESQPENYEEIKSIIDTYATADDMMDDRLVAARASIRAKGQEAVPALVLLFKNNTDDQYRSAIVDALQHNKGQHDISISFLVEQLQSEPESWKGKYWIAKTIEFLTIANGEKARIIARKALNYHSDYVKSAAVNSLATVGTSEDAERLKSLISTRRLLFKKPEYDGLSTRAENAINQIFNRVSPGNNSITPDNRNGQQEYNTHAILSPRNNTTNQQSSILESGPSWLLILGAVVAVLLGGGGFICLLRKSSKS